MSQNSPRPKTSGFTLVEMLVIAPIALLIIAGFIALMVNMVGDIMVSAGRNSMTHDIQGSLDMMERDVRLSTAFLATTGALPSPQGKDGATAAFTSTSGDLILGQIATDKNPIDPARQFIRYSNAPYSCSDSTQGYKNRLFFTTIMYFVKNGSLWRRTFVPTPSGTLCAQPWQVNTCAPGYAATATQCKTNDTEVMKNVGSFTVTYYAGADNNTPLPAGSAPSATTVRAQINGQQNIAGRTLTATASVRTTKLSDRDITLAPPGIPVVTAQPYDVSRPASATFTWTADPLVTYGIRYNINGGPWIMAAESTKNTSINLAAYRNDTITVQVSARNTTGSSGFGGGASMTLPSWDDCTLENGWVNYGGSHATCGYTKTTGGIILLKGLIKIPNVPPAPTDNQTLFTLPPPYRPSYRLVFAASAYDSTNTNGVSARVDILPTGEVRVINGNTGWVSLSNINFLAGGTLYRWADGTIKSGWANYGGSFPPFQATTDADGRVHLQGRLTPTSGSSPTTLAQVPAGYRPPQTAYYPTAVHDYKLIDATSGDVTIPSTIYEYYLMEAMYYPASFAGWTNLTLQNGWVNYGSGYSTPQFTRSSDCVVSVKGLIKSGSTSSGVVIATLPVGYRPKETLIFAGTSSTRYYRMQVESNGNIRLYYSSPTWTSIDGLNFIAGDGSPCPP